MSLAILRRLSAPVVLLGAGLICVLFAGHAGAAVTYWDPQGTTGANPFTGSMTGTWETSSWSTAANGVGSASPVAWIEQTAPVFAVHSGIGTPAYTITMNADHQIAGAFDGSLTPNSSDVTITGSGHWQLANGQGFNLHNAGDGSLAMLRINVPIVDGNYASATTGQVVAEGNGQLFLNAANTYSGGNFGIGTGGTLLGYASANFDGIVNFNNNQSFGTGNITVMRGVSGDSGALVAENSGIAIPNILDFSQAVVSGGGANATPFLNVVGSSVASGGTTFSGNVLLGTKAVNLGSGGAGNLVILSGVVSGTGSLTKFNASTLALTGANTYSGATNVGNGILSVASINRVSGGTATSNMGHPTTVATGTIGLGATTTAGTLSYTGGGETTDRVVNLAGTTGGAVIDQSGAGNLKFTANMTATGAGVKTLTLQGSTAGTGEIAGKIVDNSGTNKTSVTKSGSGTWVLSGANTYTGATTVSAGTLLANNTTGSGTGGGNVTVNGGTFGGTGAITGSVAVNSGGTLSPGGSASVGAFSTGALSFASGGKLLYEIDSSAPLAAAADLVNANGGVGVGLSIASGSLLTLADVANTPVTVPVGTRFTMISYSGTWDNGTFSGAADDSVITLGGDFYVINYNDTNPGVNFGGGSFSNYVTLTAVPEAGSLMLGSVVCLALGSIVGWRKIHAKHEVT